MKESIRKILVILMTITMVTVPFQGSFALEESNIITERGTDYYVELDKNTGFLVYAQAGDREILDIPETIEGVTVEGIRKDAIKNEDHLSTIKIPKTIKTIEEGTFAHCYKLYSVQADSNNINFTVQDGALMTADKTRIIVFPAKKSDAAEFNIPASVTEIDSGAFAFNESINSLDIPGSVKNIKPMTFREFQGTVKLNEGTESIGDEAFMAYGSVPLTDFYIPDSVTEIGTDAFNENVSGTLHFGKGIKSLNSHDNMRGVKAAGFTVSEENPVYSSKDGFVLTKDGKGIVLLPAGKETINVPEGVETIKTGALSETEAKTINIPVTLKEIEDGGLKGNRSLSDVNVAAGNTSFASEGGMLLTVDKKTLLYIPEGRNGKETVPSGVETVAKGAFNRIEGVDSLTLSDSVKTIKADAIVKDGNLELNIGKGVTLIEQGAVKVINYSSRINVSLDNTSYRTDEDGGLLLTKDGTRLVLLTNKAAEKYAETIDYGRYLEIPEGISTVGSYAIYNVSSFRGIIFGSGVQTVEPYAVYNCHEIGSIKAEGVEIIKDYAFAGMSNLNKAYIGSGLKSIGKGSFGGSLQDIVISFNGSRAKWDKISGSSIENISYSEVVPEDPELKTTVTVQFMSNSVTVTGGTGGGDYSEGETVRIKADNPADFTGWTAEGVTLEDSGAPETTFVMPGNDVNITADRKSVV